MSTHLGRAERARVAQHPQRQPRAREQHVHAPGVLQEAHRGPCCARPPRCTHTRQDDNVCLPALRVGKKWAKGAQGGRSNGQKGPAGKPAAHLLKSASDRRLSWPKEEPTRSGRGGAGSAQDHTHAA